MSTVFRVKLIMANSIYNLENRIHQFATGIPSLSGYFVEYTGYLTGTVPFSISYKVEREIAHKYQELSGVAYVSGDLG